MLIPVVYPNGTHDMVKDFYLDYLISAKKIDRFKRSSGWVSTSSADIRGKNSSAYSGPERRQTLLEDEPEDEMSLSSNACSF